MIRLPLLFLILLTAFGLPRGAGAQGVFEFEPDTLFYTDGIELVVARSVETGPVILDSLSMIWGEEGKGQTWDIGAVVDSTSESFRFVNMSGWSEPDTLEANLMVLPGDSLQLSFSFDRCIVCFGGFAQADTLVFHSNGLVANDTLILDWAGLIADEEGPLENPPGIQLNVHPNPATHRLHIALALESPADVSVSVFDTRGRRIAVLQNGPLTSGDHTLMWDSSETAPGLYVIRVRTEDMATSKTVTITHKLVR